MALKATIFKADINIADIDRHYYEDHNLTIARHPSETDERMMLRLLAFALNAGEDLQFTRGISTDNEPDLWQKSLIGDINLWIDLGMPDEKRVRQACQRAHQVIIYCYGGGAANIWWESNAKRLKRFDNLTVVNLPDEITRALANMARRTMQLHFNIQENQVSVSDAEQSLLLEPEIWLAPQ